MAIRYFLSLSCLFHALALVFFVSLYPIVSAEAIRKEIVVYITEAPDFSRHAENAAGKIEAQAPVRAPAKEDVRKPVESDVRDVPDSLADSAKAFQDVILSEAKDLTPKEIKGLSDSSSPSAPQNDKELDLFNNLLANNAGKQLDSHFRGNDGDIEEFSGEGGGQRKSEESAGDGMALEGEVSGKGPSFDMEGFRDLLLMEIQGRKVYPISARKLGIEGEVHITFRVFPDGQFRDITANGKHERLSILEKAAVELIRNVSSSPLSPSSDVNQISAEGVPVQLVISYHLEDRKGGGRE